MAKRTEARRNPKGGSSSAAMGLSVVDLPAWDSSSGRLHVVVDTPAGSRAKFKYDLEKRCYTIAHILPPGAVFPFDFGSIPCSGNLRSAVLPAPSPCRQLAVSDTSQ